MKLIATGNREWENKHEIFTEKIHELYIAANEDGLGALEGYNDTTRGIQQLIAEAIAKDIPMRALGAGWSWTKIATAKNGIMLDTKQLNTTMRISTQSASIAYTGDINKLVFAQCGNGIWELSKELRPQNLSLKTSGASNGQTIVGAMSTGAHGATLDVGAVQDYIVGIHLIVGPDRHVWLERKSYPVVSTSFITKLQTELIQDDDLFNSALVSFGSFGFIHGVMVETEELFLLETYMRRMPYDDALKKIMETLEFDGADFPYGSERPFHLQVSLNPYDMDKGAYVFPFYKRPYQENYVRPFPNNAGLGPGDDAPCFIGKLTNIIPDLVPFVVNTLLADALQPFEKQFGTLGEIFNNTTLHGKLFSSAIGIPIGVVNRVTEILFEVNKTAGPFPGFFAYRFIKKSNAKLAFTKFDYTCVLELDAAPSQLTTDFYNEFWKRLDEENIPFTFHWGKLNQLDFARISKMYGEDADTWIAARNKLLDAATRKVFTNPLLKEWGLDKEL
ncbi:MAG: FAD-binding protein [Ferruginibacter sp.]